MSPTPNRRGVVARLRPRPDDDGFTLVELMAAMVLFALVSSAAIGMFVTGMRASLVVRLDTGAKALTQERIEIMRNLTYHIPFVAAPATNPPDFLDTYYRTSLTAAGAISGATVPAGYVSSAQTGTTYRLADEPSAGAFYRFAQAPVTGFPKYKQYVATQFIDASGTAQTPDTGYNSQTVSPGDEAKTSYVGVTIITKWTSGTLSKSYTVNSRLSDGQPAKAQVNIQGRMSAVYLKTSTAAAYDPSDQSWTDPTQLVVTAATVGMDGSMSTGGQAAATAEGASAALAPGGRIEGATAGVSVPPAGSTASDSESSKTLSDANGQVAGFASTAVSNVSASVSSSLPSAATVASPVSAALEDGGAGAYALKLANNPVGRDNLQLNAAKPQAYMEDGTGNAATTTGYLASTSGSTHRVTAGMTATSRFMSLLPTTFAPDGIVQLRLVSSDVTCVSSGSSPTITGTYTAEVKYWRYDASTGSSGYVTLNVGTSGSTTLTDALLATVQVGVAPDGITPLLLKDYITTWSNVASVAGLGQTFTNGNGVQVDVAGLVSVETVPTRLDTAVADDLLTIADERLDTTSTIGAQLGGVSCVAEDNR